MVVRRDITRKLSSQRRCCRRRVHLDYHTATRRLSVNNNPEWTQQCIPFLTGEIRNPPLLHNTELVRLYYKQKHTNRVKLTIEVPNGETYRNFDNRQWNGKTILILFYNIHLQYNMLHRRTILPATYAIIMHLVRISLTGQTQGALYRNRTDNFLKLIYIMTLLYYITTGILLRRLLLCCD